MKFPKFLKSPSFLLFGLHNHFLVSKLKISSLYNHTNKRKAKMTFYVWLSKTCMKFQKFLKSPSFLLFGFHNHFLVSKIKISSLYNHTNERKPKMKFYVRFSKTCVKFLKLPLSYFLDSIIIFCYQN